MENITKDQKDTTSNLLKIKIIVMVLVTTILITSVVLIVKFSKSKTKATNSASNTPTPSTTSNTGSGGASSDESGKTTKHKTSVIEIGEDNKKDEDEEYIEVFSSKGGDTDGNKGMVRLTKLEDGLNTRFPNIEKNTSNLKEGYNDVTLKNKNTKNKSRHII